MACSPAVSALRAPRQACEVSRFAALVPSSKIRKPRTTFEFNRSSLTWIFKNCYSLPTPFASSQAPPQFKIVLCLLMFGHFRNAFAKLQSFALRSAGPSRDFDAGRLAARAEDLGHPRTLPARWEGELLRRTCAKFPSLVRLRRFGDRSYAVSEKNPSTQSQSLPKQLERSPAHSRAHMNPPSFVASNP